MRTLPSTLGPLFLFPLLTAVACAGDNFAPDNPAGAGGTTGQPSGGTTGAGPNSGGKGGSLGEAGAGSDTSAGKGGSGAAGEPGGGGTDAGQGGTETGAGGDDASAGEGGSTGDSGAAGAPSTGGKGGTGGSSGTGGAGGKAGSAGATTGTGGKAGSAGTSGIAGAGGSANGGAAGATIGGAAGTAGSGGAPGIACGDNLPECAGESYCDQEDHVCRSCGNLEPLRFGPSTARVTPGVGDAGNNRTDLAFPRVAAVAGQRTLYFRATQGGATDTVATTINGQGNPTGSVNTGCCTNKPTDDSGAILVPPGMDGNTFGAVANHGSILGQATPYLIVDGRRDFNLTGAGAGSNPTGPLARRRFHIAQWDTDGPQANGDLNGYGPIPLLNSGLDDYSLAFATSAPAGSQRFYWMSRRGDPESTSLRTLVLGGTAGQSTAVSVKLSGCSDAPEAGDYRPWLTPDGTRLIISARCQQGQPAKLWVTTPQADGTLSDATPLSIGQSKQEDADEGGSLTPNKCELWFSRNGAIHSARRR